jgi:hypothetical protein
MADERIVGRLVFLLGGFLVWAGHLTFLYGFHALVCARPNTGTETPGMNVVPLTIGAATLIAIGLNLAILLTAIRGRGPGIGGESDTAIRQFWRYGTAVVAGFSLLAVAWSGFPVIVIRSCG